MQTLHRSRDRLVGERTALINQLRAILLERGMVAPQGKGKLEQFLAVLMDEQGGAEPADDRARCIAGWLSLQRASTRERGWCLCNEHIFLTRGSPPQLTAGIENALYGSWGKMPFGDHQLF